MVTGSSSLDILKSVLTIPTAPFHEHRVAAFVQSFSESLGLGAVEDDCGNLIVRYRCGRDRAPLAFVAHMDHPGFEVITASGTTALLRGLGDTRRQQAIGARIVAQTRDGEVRGVIESAVESVREPGWRYDASFEARVKRRDFAHWDLPGYRKVGTKIHSRAIDDLAGVAALLCALRELVISKAPADLFAVFTRAEEVGFLGAIGLIESGALTRAVPVVSIEMSKALPGAVQGKGYVVRLGDGAGLFDGDLTGYLLSQACRVATRAEASPYQYRIMSGGTCEATAFRVFGYRASGVCLPLGNYHNQGRHGIAPENIHVDDFLGLVRFLTGAAQGTWPLESEPGAVRLVLSDRMRKYKKRLLARV